ncbi:MAG: hypothetical protein FWE45_05290 [Firmicutes bacterium]|nr:hypothetical protein [Bacillota bacterium]
MNKLKKSLMLMAVMVLVAPVAFFLQGCSGEGGYWTASDGEYTFHSVAFGNNVITDIHDIGLLGLPPVIDGMPISEIVDYLAAIITQTRFVVEGSEFREYLGHHQMDRFEHRVRWDGMIESYWGDGQWEPEGYGEYGMFYQNGIIEMRFPVEGQFISFRFMRQ